MALLKDTEKIALKSAKIAAFLTIEHAVSFFHDLPLHKQLLKAIDGLGYEQATPVQQQTLPKAMTGKDIMVSAKTGSGKTAAFLLPMLERFLQQDAADTATRGLILLPTRELALQTQKIFKQLAGFTQLKCGLIIGGEAFKHQVATLRKNPEVVIATPGRLVEHIERGTTDFNDLEFLVLDEADRMLDMGFSEDMNTIARACNTQRQTLLFSATLQHRAISNIKGIFNDAELIETDLHREGHSHITQQRILADDQKHKEALTLALIENLLHEKAIGKVFIFCKTRAATQQLGNFLKYKKIKAAFIHGEIPQNLRKQVINHFHSGQAQVLVATDVAARGLDIDDVDLVVNFDMAQSGDDYVHRIGRTGRAGKEGLAVSLIEQRDYNLASSIERYLKTRFENIVLPGLKAKYTGPGKVKASGKAASDKKRKVKSGKKGDKKAVKKKNPSKAKKASSPKAKPAAQKKVGDGTGALRKRK